MKLQLDILRPLRLQALNDMCRGRGTNRSHKLPVRGQQLGGANDAIPLDPERVLGVFLCATAIGVVCVAVEAVYANCRGGFGGLDEGVQIVGGGDDAGAVRADVEFDEDVPGSCWLGLFEEGELRGVVDEEEDAEGLAEGGELRDDERRDWQSVDALTSVSRKFSSELVFDSPHLGFPPSQVEGRP